jgi:hypothetical protein
MLGSASGLAGNWGSGFIFVHFSDLNLVNYSETFFSLSDKAMRGIGLLALSAFFKKKLGVNWVSVPRIDAFLEI